MTKTVAIVSGGLDSVILAHKLKAENHDLSIVSFDYGQRHSKELNFAEQCAKDLDAPWHLVDLSNMTDLLENCALTNMAMEIPDGHYAEQTMKITVVPNRNAIMLNIAAGLAISIQAKHIATGVHGGDHYIYPDCRPAFIKAIDTMLSIANEGFAVYGFSVLAPFLYSTKTDIAAEGSALNVDFTKTWSCYKGGEIHCGSCGTCFERREAFKEAGVFDPTQYLATPEYADPRK